MDGKQPAGEAFDGGSGSDLVVLHGLGGSWHIWRPVLGLLTGRHRVIAPTLPGHPGGPPLPKGAVPTVALLTDLMIEDLRRRGIRHPHVAGNSLGGWIAIEMARRGYAQSVTALSPAGGWQTPADYQAIAKMFRIIFRLLPLMIFLFSWLLRFAGVRRALNAQAMEHGDRVPPDESRRAMRTMRGTRMLPALLDSMERVGGVQPFRVAPPRVVIAWCEHDKVIPHGRYGAALTTVVQGAEAATVVGCGHVPMYDDPAQVASIIFDTCARAEADARPQPEATA